MSRFKGRVAIVTGAASGIGKQIAVRIAAEGGIPVIADLNLDAANATAREIAAKGGDAFAVAMNVVDEAQVEKGVADTVAKYGKIDVLVNNAAIVPFTAWDDIDFAEWRRIMSVNLDGTFLMCRHVSDAMRPNGYGRIVNIASNVIVAGTPNLAQYVASKGGVFGFTRALATELGKYGITVNQVAPGLTASEGVNAGPHAEAFDFVQMLQSIPRRGVPADIAPAVAFLASEESGWVTGQMLVADGGHTRH